MVKNVPSEVTDLERVLGLADDKPTRRPPILVIASGRGQTGKSTLLSYLAAACKRVYPLRVIDADPKNSSLSTRHADAEIPAGIDEDARVWLEAQFDRLVSEAGTIRQHDMLLDLGGGDLRLRRWGHDVALAESLIEAGVDPVLLHLLGTSDQDLAHVADLELGGVFAPPKTVLVVNSGLVPTASLSEAFSEAGKSEVVQSVVGRGGRLVFMPHLGCLRDMEKDGVTFTDAVGGDLSKLRFLDRIRARRWVREDMPKMLDPVRDWLPEMVDLREGGG
jgi:hypothetical protein